MAGGCANTGLESPGNWERDLALQQHCLVQAAVDFPGYSTPVLQRGIHVCTSHGLCTASFKQQAELAELSQREEEGLENALCAVRQRDREHQAALQQLLLPLPADTKATMLAQAASAGCATPSSCGAGGGVPAALMSGGFATPLTGGSGMGAGGGSSASGVRGALGLGSSSMTKR